MELLRLLRAGESERTISRSLHHNRRTIARYRA
jgi:DNA-binding CsgD family transcriptional regulator